MRKYMRILDENSLDMPLGGSLGCESKINCYAYKAFIKFAFYNLGLF